MVILSIIMTCIRLWYPGAPVNISFPIFPSGTDRRLEHTDIHTYLLLNLVPRYLALLLPVNHSRNPHFRNITSPMYLRLRVCVCVPRILPLPLVCIQWKTCPQEVPDYPGTPGYPGTRVPGYLANLGR